MSEVPQVLRPGAEETVTVSLQRRKIDQSAPPPRDVNPTPEQVHPRPPPVLASVPLDWSSLIPSRHLIHLTVSLQRRKIDQSTPAPASSDSPTSLKNQPGEV